MGKFSSKSQISISCIIYTKFYITKFYYHHYCNDFLSFYFRTAGQHHGYDYDQMINENGESE